MREIAENHSEENSENSLTFNFNLYTSQRTHSRVNLHTLTCTQNHMQDNK